jgi:D-galactose 1-dehydrogenase
MTISMAIVGGGKIARDQHVPAIVGDASFALDAAVTLADARLPGIPNFDTIAQMKTALPGIQAVALCTPPGVRYSLALQAIAAGLDVLNEKPPAATLAEADAIARAAAQADRVFYQTWHSREAAAVEPARTWLAGKRILRVTVTWKEDVRVWHPGQAWIWEPGIGVFDPGINALSVVSHILPGPLRLGAAELRFPENMAAPIAADLDYTCTDFPVSVSFDFDQRGPQSWDIDITTDGGVLTLSHGASRMMVDGVPVSIDETPEYARLYRRFAQMLQARRSDVDFTPFHLVADAFLRGQRKTVAPFT